MRSISVHLCRGWDVHGIYGSCTTSHLHKMEYLDCLARDPSDVVTHCHGTSGVGIGLVGLHLVEGRWVHSSPLAFMEDGEDSARPLQAKVHNSLFHGPYVWPCYLWAPVSLTHGALQLRNCRKCHIYHDICS